MSVKLIPFGIDWIVEEEDGTSSLVSEQELPRTLDRVCPKDPTKGDDGGWKVHNVFCGACGTKAFHVLPSENIHVRCGTCKSVIFLGGQQKWELN